MQRTLSSSLTVVWKFLFPTVWITGFGAATVGLWLGAFRGRDQELPPDAMRWISLSVWLVASTFLIWFARRLHRVSLHDGVLTVSNYFREISVPLANVSRVTESYMRRPPTITLHLDNPTALGQRIVFVPAGRSRFFSEHPTTTELKNILSRMHKDGHANA